MVSDVVICGLEATNLSLLQNGPRLTFGTQSSATLHSRGKERQGPLTFHPRA
jgi:hypothetical protein